MSILGKTEIDLVGALLGTGYESFESPTGINGLAKTSGDRLDILAVDATRPGTGQFRLFIDLCKKEFATICVWEVMNPAMNTILQKYGFHPTEEVSDGETLRGWRWHTGLAGKTDAEVKS